MAATPAVVKTLLTPTDLDGTWFHQDPVTKKYVVAKAMASTDAGNLIAVGSDGFLKILQGAIQAAQITYTFGLDATSGKLTMTPSTGTSGGAVDPHAFEAQLTGASISNGVITFTDNAGKVTGTLNTAVFLQQISVAAGNGYTVTGNGTAASPITLTLVPSATAGNLLKIDATGHHVDSADIVALLNANITHTLAATAASGVFQSVVNGQGPSLPIVQLQDAAGNVLGLIFAPA